MVPVCQPPAVIEKISYPTGPAHVDVGTVVTAHYSFQLWQSDPYVAFRKGDRIKACDLSDPIGNIGANTGPLQRRAAIKNMENNVTIRQVLLSPDDYLAMKLPHPPTAWYMLGTRFGVFGPFSSLKFCTQYRTEYEARGFAGLSCVEKPYYIPKYNRFFGA